MLLKLAAQIKFTPVLCIFDELIIGAKMQAEHGAEYNAKTNYLYEKFGKTHTRIS